MSHDRDPRPIHDPVPQVDEAARRRLVRLLLTGGAAGVLAGAALGMTVHVLFLVLGLLGGLVFTVGLLGVANRKEAALPAFVVGVGAPLVLTFGGHSVLMDRLGHVERCVVEQVEEHRTQKRPVVEYVLGCPSGDVELTEDWRDRLRTSEAEVLVGPPLRPVLAEPDLWNLPLVTGVLVAMTAAIPVAHVLRRRP